MEVPFGNLDIDDSSENLFVFHESVSTLQNIASNTVALQLWHHYLNRAKCRKIQDKTNDLFRTVFNLDADYEKETKKLAELLKTPRRIEEMLKESLEKICDETKQWIHHFNIKIFRKGISRYHVRNFDPNHIVWRPNGEIDYKKSVSKMLAEGKLNTEQKFILMCSYGMATELENFPTNSLPEFFCLLGITHLKIAYWISHHKHDLREMWLRMPDMIRPEDTSVNVTMAMAMANSSLDSVDRTLPYAFEYFWNRLSEEEQLAVALRILPRLGSREIRKIILSTMPSFQQRQLIDQIPIELMKKFSVLDYSAKHCMPENVFIVWTLVKDRITEQQFVEFLRKVLRYEMRSEKYMIMLNSVWDTASDRLKRHIVENRPDIIFLSFMNCMVPYPPSSYRLFMKFVPLLNEHTRKTLFLSSESVWGEYDMIVSKCDIDILNLCLPEEADQLQLKNRIMESRDLEVYCNRLFRDRKFDEAIARVTFFSQNAHDAREFFKKVLVPDRNFDDSFIMEYESWNKLSNFIDTVFTDDFLTISKLKKQLVFSLSPRALDCWDKKENFSVLVKITEQVFSAEEMKTFKRTLLKSFQETILSQRSWRDFKGKCYNTFISWCSEDESRIIDLKDVFPVDAFFDDKFRTICSSPNADPKHLLNRLNAFLKYVCVSNEEVELVKIRKYFERDRYWIRQVEQIFGEIKRRTILNWFLSVKK
ncbi:uncharacterized protein LOC135840151 isoform X2 [Planococcus citri]|uniref:uncharacterized protein LOC135840151 isoform X2 n=1 Tax=Planococcus citri TaxID=170843 RepID=UPI0031F86560